MLPCFNFHLELWSSFISLIYTFIISLGSKYFDFLPFEIFYFGNIVYSDDKRWIIIKVTLKKNRNLIICFLNNTQSSHTLFNIFSFQQFMTDNTLNIKFIKMTLLYKSQKKNTIYTQIVLSSFQVSCRPSSDHKSRRASRYYILKCWRRSQITRGFPFNFLLLWPTPTSVKSVAKSHYPIVKNTLIKFSFHYNPARIPLYYNVKYPNVLTNFPISHLTFYFITPLTFPLFFTRP